VPARAIEMIEMMKTRGSLGGRFARGRLKFPPGDAASRQERRRERVTLARAPAAVKGGLPAMARDLY